MSISSPLGSAVLAIGRLLLAAIFLLVGWSKLRGCDAAAAYMNSFGVPGALLPAVIAVEIVGGLLVLAVAGAGRWSLAGDSRS
ncbi:MAG: DoxX family protein [Hyphomicrobiaceae bacterium]